MKTRMLAMATVSSMLFLVGCAHKITQQEREDFLAQQSDVSFAAKKALPPSTMTRLPLKAGQWAIIATHFKAPDGDMSFSKHKILHVTSDSLTMEIETTRAGGKKPTVMAYVIDHFPTGRQVSMTKAEMETFLANVEFKRIVIKSGDAAPTELPLAFVPMTKSYLKNMLLAGYRIGDITPERCESEVLSSKKCMGYDYVIDLPGYSGKGHADAHSAVPVVGFVKVEDDKVESHVVAYGLSGATGTLIK